jgi:replicative DNA helicase
MRTDRLKTLHSILEETDGRLKAGESAGARVWPSGFSALDRALTGGFRSGELVIMGGRPGLGKTTFALQVARNLIASNHRVLYFSFEHDNDALLGRLIVMEAAVIAGLSAVGLPRIRQAFEARHSSDLTMEGRLAGTEGGVEAVQALQDYAMRLHIHRSSGSETDLGVMREIIEAIREDTGQRPFVVVDYLQKVHAEAPTSSLRVSERLSEEDRVTTVVEGLKDLALELAVPVLALAAVDNNRQAAATRVRLQDLRGSSSLAHEADVVLILNDKFDVVARHHLMYNLNNAARYRSWVVMTIEKNRNGVSNVDLEFRKRFEHSRFEPDGGMVSEELIDDRIFVE